MSLLRIFADKLRGETSAEEQDWQRVQQELKGSILGLITLFLSVSFLSYLPLDSINIFRGKIDHICNLGGLLGGLIAEWFLGTLGLSGYMLILATTLASLTYFLNRKIRSWQWVGLLIGTFLSSLAIFLIFNDRVPEASLLQGGWVGLHIGGFLKTYLNTTGALLLVGGLFFITVLLTFRLSITPLVRDSVEVFLPAPAIEEASEETTQTITRPKLASVSALPTKKAPKKRKSKNAASADDANVSNTSASSALDGSLVTTDDEFEQLDLSAPSGSSFPEIIPFTESFTVPSLRLLKSASNQPKKMTKSEAKQVAQTICNHLLSFQITGDIVAVTQGPVLTTYEFRPSAGIKLSKIAALQEDLGVVLGTRELRIIAPIPGKTVVGIEVPRPQTEMITLKDLLSEKGFNDKKMKVPFALGKTTEGLPAFGDMSAMPHLLVAGSTGSGKSVFVNSLIMSFLFKMSPQELRLILIDPKMLEFSAFDGIPHLISNVITDNQIATNALNWAVQEMDRRYSLMAKSGSKNIESYNSKLKGKDKLPFIVIVVDELADLMMSGGDTVEVSITRLAQKSRAAGIHMVIATQRPSTDIVTGLIKANIPSRIAFKVTSGIDSRTILDASGAEELIGRGDSLMIQPAVPMRRLHGAFVTEEELHRTTKYLKYKDFSKYYIKF